MYPIGTRFPSCSISGILLFSKLVGYVFVQKSQCYVHGGIAPLLEVFWNAVQVVHDVRENNIPNTPESSL